MFWLTIVATIALGALAVAVGAGIRGVREERDLRHAVALLSLARPFKRPDSWHPDRTGDNKHPSRGAKRAAGGEGHDGRRGLVPRVVLHLGRP